jgi:hypothetical protein
MTGGKRVTQQETTQKTPREILETFSHMDDLLLADPETDGMAFQLSIWGQVARDQIKEYGDEIPPDFVAQYQTECQRRWQAGKFYITWQEAENTGKDPHTVFAEKGWEM